MSAVDEYIIERQNEQQELKLASLLGITIDELSNLNYDIYDDEGHDGTLYGYIVIIQQQFVQRYIVQNKRIRFQ